MLHGNKIYVAFAKIALTTGHFLGYLRHCTAKYRLNGPFSHRDRRMRMPEQTREQTLDLSDLMRGIKRPGKFNAVFPKEF